MMNSKDFCFLIVLINVHLIFLINGLPEQGLWDTKVDEKQPFAIFSKTMYNQTSIFTQIKCTSLKNDTKIKVGWLLRNSPCAGEYSNLTGNNAQIQMYYNNPKASFYSDVYKSEYALKSTEVEVICNQNPIHLPVLIRPPPNSSKLISNVTSDKGDKPLVSKAWEDGVYVYIIKTACKNAGCDFKADLKVWMKASYGYLSAMEWPLFIFYGVMCLVYLTFGIFWLVLSACYWRDLLRIQFWIGAVIFLGMLEKAFFYAEYHSINNTGQSIKGAVIFAQIISCLKRSLARLLVMIACIGYGIVKPRLGPALRKIVVIVVLYFIFALVEACIRVLTPRFDRNRVHMYAYIPLAVIDTVIVWWTFTYLVQTLRQLRVRRNTVKYNLYRHFSNILILLIVASLIFITWVIYTFQMQKCNMNWQDLWVDEAFWHILFSVILLVIIWLWRPSNNNQRYAYSPVLDEDDGADDEDVLMDNISSGDMKKLSKARENGKVKGKERKSTAEDDLKWIEEHIPASVAEQAYPLIDSEEEITTSNITASKIE